MSQSLCCSINLDRAVLILGAIEQASKLINKLVNEQIKFINDKIAEGVFSSKQVVDDAIAYLDSILNDLIPDLNGLDELECYKRLIEKCSLEDLKFPFYKGPFDIISGITDYLNDLTSIPASFLSSISDQLFAMIYNDMLSSLDNLTEFVLGGTFDKIEKTMNQMGKMMKKYEAYINCVDALGCTDELSQLQLRYETATLTLPTTANVSSPTKKRFFPSLPLDMDSILDETDADDVVKENIKNTKKSMTDSLNKLRNTTGIDI